MILEAAALGSLALGAAGSAGLFGDAKKYGFTKEDVRDLYTKRSSEIDSFSKELADMRAQYLAQIPGIQMAAFNRFGADAAAKFGANGIGVDSGAFSSALAREAIPMQGQMYDTAFQTGSSNARAVDASRGNAFGSTIGAFSANTAPPTQNPLWAALGKFSGESGILALKNRADMNLINTAKGPNISSPGVVAPPTSSGRYDTWA